MELLYQRAMKQRLKRVELLETTNILFFICESNPNILYGWNDQLQTIIAEIETKTPILALKVRKDKLVIGTLTRIFVYNIFSFTDPVLIETAENPTGVLQITTSGKFLIATLGANGQDLVIREPEDSIGKLHTYITVAHKTPIRRIALSPDGTKVATASEKGTIFRIFDVVTGSKLKEVRRGMYQSPILDMDMAGEVLMSISQNKTVHWHDLKIRASSYFSFIETSIEKYSLAVEDLASKRETATYVCKILNETDSIVIGNHGEYFLFRGMKMREKALYKDQPSAQG